MVWDRATWVQAHRLQGLQAVGMPWAPQKYREELARTQWLREGPCAPDTAQSLALCLHNAQGLSVSRNRLEALWSAGVARVPNWEVTLFLLACWVLVYFSVWKGLKSLEARYSQGRTGLGQHFGCGGTARDCCAMGGDCIRGCTSIWPLSPTLAGESLTAGVSGWCQ